MKVKKDLSIFLKILKKKTGLRASFYTFVSEKFLTINIFKVIFFCFIVIVLFLRLLNKNKYQWKRKFNPYGLLNNLGFNLEKLFLFISCVIKNEVNKIYSDLFRLCSLVNIILSQLIILPIQVMVFELLSSIKAKLIFFLNFFAKQVNLIAILTKCLISGILKQGCKDFSLNFMSQIVLVLKCRDPWNLIAQCISVQLKSSKSLDKIIMF